MRKPKKSFAARYRLLRRRLKPYRLGTTTIVGRWLDPTCLIGLAYFVSGKLALLLAIPPGYATAVWPAAGLALGGILVFGNRIWPGVLIGSFAVNAGTALDTSTIDTILRTGWLPAVIGVGATLQALFGAFLVRRYIGMPTPLADAKDTVRFLLVTTTSSLIASTVGVTVLWIGGLVAPRDCLVNWTTWWVGDTIGTLIFAPLVIIWKARRRGWRSKLSLCGPMALAFGLVVALFLQASRSEQAGIKLEFDRRADHLSQRAQREFEQYVDVVRAIERFFAGSPEVTQERFHTFVAHYFSEHPGIQALSWDSRVPDQDRRAFETGAHANGSEIRQIKQHDAHSNLIPADRRPEYFPTRYIEPAAGNERALGFDAGSDPVRTEALAQARDTGQPRATAQITLAQDSAAMAGCAVYVPIYAHFDHDTVESRRRQLQGYVAAVFRTADVMAQVLKKIEPTGIEFRLRDETAPASTQLLFTSSTNAFKEANLQRKSSFEMAGRQWALEFFLSPNYLLAHRSWHSWNVLVEGLVFTALLGVFLLVVIGRKERDEVLVAVRTSDLVATNAMLEREMAERIAAQNEVRVSEEKLRAITNSIGDAVISADLEGKMIFWNPAAERIFGYSQEEALGKRLTLIIPERYHAAHCAGLARVQTERQHSVSSRTVELQGLCKDGSEVPVELSFSWWQTGDGRFFTGILRNITERKVAQEKLRRSEEQLRLLVKSVQEYAIYMLDRKGHITTWNPGAERIKHYRPDEIIGRHYEIFFTPADRGKGLPDHLLAQAEAKGSMHVQGIRVRKDGSRFRVEAIITAVRDEHGNVCGFSKVTRDITEQSRQREASEKARVAAETLNKEKDKFLAILSHELRTPLTPVLALVGYLAKQTGKLPRVLRGEMAMIRRNVELEARLIDDVLDVTRITTGKLELALEVTDAHAAIHHAFDICAEKIKTKRLEVRLELKADVHVVLADPVRLHQIFWNLISNSVKFTPPGKRILVQSFNATSKQFNFEIEDHGIGIEPDALPHIFEAFEQGDRAITREFGGLGLGLAITDALVDLHHGRLEAFSDGRNKGATFKLALKVATKNTIPTLAPTTPGPTSTLRILVVDDHEDTKRVLSQLLRSRGHEVFVADSVASALHIVREETIDVLLSDIGLPDGTGHDLMRRAKMLQPLAGIALSGFGTAEDVASAIEAGFAHHLIKPVSFERLETVLASVTSKQTFAGLILPIPGLAAKVS